MKLHKTTSILRGLALAALPAMMAGCSTDEIPGVKERPGAGTLTIRLSDGDPTRAGEDPVAMATSQERNISLLRYFLFPTDGKNKPLTHALMTPDPDELSSGAKEYIVTGIPSGKYRFYILANIDDAEGIATEDDLKKIMHDHSEKFPDPGHLPMVYQSNGELTFDDQGNVEEAALKYACVKVKYNLVFDPDVAKPYGRMGFKVDEVSAERLTRKTPVIEGSRFADWTTTFNTALPAGEYYTDFDRDDAATSGDVITPSGASGISDYTKRNVYTCTLYLPERYGEKKGDFSRIHFKGRMVDATGNGTNEVEYYLNLGEDTAGHVLTEESAEEHPSFGRGRYYEITADLKKPQGTQVDATLKVKDWTVFSMSGDLTHPELHVDKTRVEVTFTAPGELHYDSNLAVTGGCTATDADKRPLFLVSCENGVATVRLNPAISYDSFGEGEGQLPLSSDDYSVYLQAGNLRKYIDVSYDVSPYFNVDPLTTNIEWIESQTTDYYVREFRYETNLSGITPMGFAFGKRYNADDDGNPVESADGVVYVENIPDAEDPTQGVIKVTARKNPGQTMTFNFMVAPGRTDFVHLRQTIEVSVKPPYTHYRIYFRPINDDQEGELKDYSSVSATAFPGTWSKCHYYIYTQMGQTVNGSIPRDWAWLFTGVWDSTNNVWPEQGQKQSDGWFLYELESDRAGVNQADANDPSKKYPTPGETLIIFTAGTDRHRMAFDDEPGIQLFDYEDKEGYYIFDPLSSPYYKVYDTKPVIESVRYRVYSQQRPTKIEMKYGGADNAKHSIWKNVSDNMVKSGTATDGSGTWYMLEFYAQAPRGNYAKALQIHYSGSTTPATLYNGQNYYSASTRGYANGILTSSGGEWRWTSGVKEMTGIEYTTRYIYLKDNGSTKWNNPFLYAFKEKDVTSSSNENAQFPGARMTSMGNGWWRMEIDRSFKYVIFNRGNANGMDPKVGQSSDILLSTPAGATDAAPAYYERTSAGTFQPTADRP
ncbi:MAG: starch-binding protein [Bacteroides sp.]|nr:starch-binding protein [Bacteroides sp.]